MEFTYYAVAYDPVTEMSLSERKPVSVRLQGSVIKIAEPVSLEIVIDSLHAELRIFIRPNDVVPALQKSLGQVHVGNVVTLKDSVHLGVTL